MRTLLILGGLAATLAGSGCRSNLVAGRCDCVGNHPESNAIAPPANPYPVVGGPPANAAPATIPTAGTPTSMPAPDKLPAVPGR